MGWPLGLVSIVFARDGARPSTRECFARAEALGFDHLDIGEEAMTELRSELAGSGGAPPLPVGDVISLRSLAPGCTTVAPRLRAGQSFDDVVALLRAHPGARIEAGPGSVAGSVDAIRALAAAVPGLRFTIDTGHVTAWGEDPMEVLDLADHVQLRQAARGRPQLHPDEGGDVDFRAVLSRLDAVGYRGRLSVEYFDLPDLGWPLGDPVGHAVALAEHVRPLLAAWP